jgi:hypothetical protein
MKLGSRGLWEKKEAERRKYAAAMEKKHAQERAEIATLEMLLDANWSQSNGCFVKVVTDPDRPGHIITRFYNRDGSFTGDDQG